MGVGGVGGVKLVSCTVFHSKKERAQERKNQSNVEISTELVCETDHQLKLKSDNINQVNSDKLG